MDRKSMRIEIGDILDRHCNGCQLKKEHARTHAKGVTSTFDGYCARECSVGKRLVELGKQINKPKSKEEKRMSKVAIEAEAADAIVAVEAVEAVEAVAVKPAGKSGRPQKDQPSCGLTKQAFLESIAAGETLSSVEKAWGMKYHTIQWWVKKWGVRGITQAKAQELLNEMNSDQPSTLAPHSIEPKSEIGEKDVEHVFSPMKTVKTVKFDPSIAKAQQEEIDRLQQEVGHWQSKAQEAVALAGESAEKLAAENESLQYLLDQVATERDAVKAQLKQMASELSTQQGELREHKQANDIIRDQIRSLSVERDKLILEVEQLQTQAPDRMEGHDPVEQPAHYLAGGLETIDILQAKLTPEMFEGFLVGNVLKYTSRYQHKNGTEDLQKANWYLKRLISQKQEAAIEVESI